MLVPDQRPAPTTGTTGRDDHDDEFAVATRAVEVRVTPFGGCRFGLEWLSLPKPTDHPEPAAPGQTISPQIEDGLLRRTENSHGRQRGEPPDVQAERDRRYWFRWITGHQVSFVVWRLAAEALSRAERGGPDQGDALAALEEFVLGYCAMLVYTGSCPRATYERTIRPSMRLRHPGFSGAWAPDFRVVRPLFRGRLDLPAAAAVGRSLEQHQRVHEAIAAKLVFGGRSLLQDSHSAAPHLLTAHRLYDDYFMTRRSAVSWSCITNQLCRRLVAIANESADHPLWIDDPTAAPQWRTSEIEQIQEGFADRLAGIARHALALTGVPAPNSARQSQACETTTAPRLTVA